MTRLLIILAGFGVIGCGVNAFLSGASYTTRSGATTAQYDAGTPQGNIVGITCVLIGIGLLLFGWYYNRLDI